MKKRASERGLSRPSCSLPLSRPRPALNSPRNSRGLRVAGRPRASARRTAWSALGRFPVAPNLAALVFLSLARELPSPLGLLNKEKKYSESPLAPPNRTAPTSPSFCSTRATSCTASSAARRRTTTPGSSTSWTRVSFFFSCSVFFEAEGATTASFGSSSRIATIQKQATPARSASSSTTPTSSTSARSASCSGEKSRKGVRDRRELVSKREERVWLFF